MCIMNHERMHPMPYYAYAIPIQAGKSEVARWFIQEVLGPRRQDYDDLQRRLGTTRECYFFQRSPEGDVLIVYGEGTGTPLHQVLDPERNPFDRWLLEQTQEMTGADPTEFGEELPEPEMLGEWRSP
jgi:hypothetical protein